METFLQQYSQQIIWLLSVTAGTPVLLWLNRMSFVFLANHTHKQCDNVHSTLQALQQIVTVFSYQLGIGLTSYVFLNESAHIAITNNLQKKLL